MLYNNKFYIRHFCLLSRYIFKNLRDIRYYWVNDRMILLENSYYIPVNNTEIYNNINVGYKTKGTLSLYVFLFIFVPSDILKINYILYQINLNMYHKYPTVNKTVAQRDIISHHVFAYSFTSLGFIKTTALFFPCKCTMTRANEKSNKKDVQHAAS